MTMKSEYYSLIQIQKVFLKKTLPRSAEIINLKKRKFETEFWQNKHGLREKKNRERTKSGKYSVSNIIFSKYIDKVVTQIVHLHIFNQNILRLLV